MEESRLNELCFDVVSNPVILSGIFKHITNFEDLKSVRQVNTLWWESSLSKWRQTAILRLCSNPMIFCLDCTIGTSFEPVNYLPGIFGQDITQFVQLVAESEEQGDECPYQLANKPYAKYRLGNCTLPELKTKDEDSDLNSLWNSCGRHIKHLYLDHCKIQVNMYADVLRAILTEKLPNLTELDVVFVTTKNSDADAPSNGNNNDNQIAQNDGDLGAGGGGDAPIKKLMRLRIERCKKPPMSPGHDWKHLPKLLRAVPNLKELQLYSEPNMITTPNSQSSHLEGLEFPHMTKLFLHGETGISFKALRGIPLLQTLWIKANNCTTNWNEIVRREAEEQILWPKLEYLHIDYNNVSAETLIVLGRWMPNLKTLELDQKLKESTPMRRVNIGGGPDGDIFIGFSLKTAARHTWPELEELNWLPFTLYT